MKTKSKIATVRTYLRAQAQAKRCYEKMDTALNRLMSGMQIEEPVDLGSDGQFKLVDNFSEGKNTAFRVASVRRFELKRVAHSRATKQADTNESETPVANVPQEAKAGVAE